MGVLHKHLFNEISFGKCASTLQILNASSYGGVHRALKTLPGYRFSEFFPDVPSGKFSTSGVLCVDLCQIPFPDESLDVVITEDVFEHLENPDAAFQEIKRVLKSGGIHIFTVPIREGGHTMNRTGMSPVYHDAPEGTGGALVWNDFSYDLVERFTDAEAQTRYLPVHTFYLPEQVTRLETEYADYLKKKDRPLFFY
ncbi:MAG: class I SAM-dependent methyltransferase [Intestinimonas sp.]|jgi:SAM-dependent methyltransferase|nr:class I SAM-dependent methyltransferase [Intestinimonas sp.]